jgi:hypothetical protein
VTVACEPLCGNADAWRAIERDEMLTLLRAVPGKRRAHASAAALV